MMFAFIIQKKSVTYKNVDVYLTPLIGEFQELWKRMDCLDGSQQNSKEKTFKLYDMLLWMVTDFSAYGLSSNQVTKGHRVFHVCSPNVVRRRSKTLTINVYLGHGWQLPNKTTKVYFWWAPHMRPPSRGMSGCEQLQYANDRHEWMENHSANQGG